MRTVRLDELRAQVRQRADQESGGQASQQLCTDAELNRYINSAWCELYEMLMDSGSDYALEEHAITTVSGTAAYALADDHFRLRGVDIAIGTSEVITAHPYMFEERNTYRTSGSWAAGYPVWYRQSGDNITFIPEPTGAYAVTVHYYPTPAMLVSDANTLDGVNGWEDYVVCTAAAKAAVKEDEMERAAKLTAEAGQAAVRIRNAAPKRDAGAPERAQDVVGWYPWQL